MNHVALRLAALEVGHGDQRWLWMGFWVIIDHIRSEMDDVETRPVTDEILDAVSRQLAVDHHGVRGAKRGRHRLAASSAPGSCVCQIPSVDRNDQRQTDAP